MFKVIMAISTQNCMKSLLVHTLIRPCLGCNHHICSKNTACDTLNWYRKKGGRDSVCPRYSWWVLSYMHQICNKYVSLLFFSAGIENVGHWHWPSRWPFDSEFHDTVFNVALIYWYRSDKRCCTSPCVFNIFNSQCSMNNKMIGNDSLGFTFLNMCIRYRSNDTTKPDGQTSMWFSGECTGSVPQICI